MQFLLMLCLLTTPGSLHYHLRSHRGGVKLHDDTLHANCPPQLQNVEPKSNMSNNQHCKRSNLYHPKVIIIYGQFKKKLLFLHFAQLFWRKYISRSATYSKRWLWWSVLCPMYFWLSFCEHLKNLAIFDAEMVRSVTLFFTMKIENPFLSNQNIKTNDQIELGELCYDVLKGLAYS